MVFHPPLAFTLAVSIAIPTPSRLRYLMRHMLNRCAHCMLRLRSRPYPMEEDGIALIFAPHQDDESLGCGGLLALKRIKGDAVHVVYITDGRASHPGHPTLTPAMVAAQRQAEAVNAMRILGVDHTALQFLGVPDGTLMHLDVHAADELVRRIAAVLQSTHPTEILLPCRHDGSSEHEAAFALVARALAQTGLRPRIMEFPVWSWWNPLLLIQPFFKSRTVWRVDFRNRENMKRQALKAYASQTQPAPPWESPLLSREFVSFFSSHEEFFFEM